MDRRKGFLMLVGAAIEEVKTLRLELSSRKAPVAWDPPALAPSGSQAVKGRH